MLRYRVSASSDLTALFGMFARRDNEAHTEMRMDLKRIRRVWQRHPTPPSGTITIADIDKCEPLRDPTYRRDDLTELAAVDPEFKAFLERVGRIAHRERTGDGFSVVDDDDPDIELYEDLTKLPVADLSALNSARLSKIGDSIVERSGGDLLRPTDAGSPD